jgi:ABC-type Na+ transport system ATPase subunit NatA
VTDQTQPSLFPEEPGKPFLDSFTIGAFRGLRDLTLDHLGRINLLVGKNNSGKTSVLEALAIFAQPEDFGTWTSIASSRTARTLSIFQDSSTFESLEWLFPKELSNETIINLDIKLTGQVVSKKYQINVACEKFRGIPPQQDLGRSNSLILDPPDESLEEDDGLLLRENSPSDGLKFAHTIWLRNGYRRNTRPRPAHPFIMLTPYGHRNEPMQLHRLTQATEENYRSRVEQLVCKLDKNILGTEILTSMEGRRPRLMIRHDKIGLAPVSVFGDGIRRALSIALAIPRAKNGLLLIDEIESALHISVLDTLYPWLVEACAEYNVQVFATTHSLEAVDAIAKLDESINGGLSAYHLSDNTDEIRRYTGGMLRRLVHERGLDIR